MKKRYLSVAVLFLLGSHSTSAGTTVLDTIIVTATRTAQTADETLSSVTVLTQDDIQRQQAQSVQELLRGLPGINIANNGGPGKATSVFMRGTESDHVLVLIDGVKIGSATSGATPFETIPVSQIERIEIVRGPRSSLYGSEAIGGVIQIFTKKGGGDLKPSFSITAGSDDTYKASIGVSGGGERGWFNLGASGIDTNGFNACNDSSGCFTTEPDDDAHRNISGSLRAGYRFTNGLEVDLHALRSKGKTEYDGSFVNESETVQQSVGGTLRFSPVYFWHTALTVGHSRDEVDSFKDGTFQSRFNTKRDTAAWQNDFDIAENQLLTLGIDYQDDKIDSTTTYAETSRVNNGLFAQYQGSFAAHDLQLSLRKDDNEQFGKHTTGGAAWGYALNESLRLTASYGTAFKAPTFNELYFPFYGNPDIEPEESRSFELGISGDSNWGRWSLNAYKTNIDNLIAYDSTIFAAANISKARIRGVEAIVSTQLNDWDINTNLTLLDPEDKSGGINDGNVLPRRARQSLRFDADRQFGAYSIGTTLRVEGKRYDDLANNTKLDGYATVDLRAEYAFAKDWKLQGRIENLFDREYETAAFYNQPERSFFITVSYQP
jgi:vitamin B12 transporter